MLRTLCSAAPPLHLTTALIHFTKSVVLFGTLDEGESTRFQQHTASELTFLYSFFPALTIMALRRQPLLLLATAHQFNGYIQGRIYLELSKLQL